MMGEHPTLATEDPAFFRAWNIDETSRYLIDRGYSKPTLQFPDEMLGNAAKVAVTLQTYCAQKGHAIQAYILADTTYNSLSVDEVAAAHIQGDCVIHYGRASLTPLSRTPAFFVFPRKDMDVATVTHVIQSSQLWSRVRDGEETVLTIVDQAHIHQQAALHEALEHIGPDTMPGSKNWIWATIPSTRLDPPVSGRGAVEGDCCCSQRGTSRSEQQDDDYERAAGYIWSSDVSPTAMLWIGTPDASTLEHLQLTYNTKSWWVLDTARDPFSLEEGLPLAVRRLLRRRYALVERARAANIVGIVVGTLGAAGYLGAVDRLCWAAESAGKKTYTLLLGKPSPAKLANFPEIEVFVLVADPQGLILDSKEYLAPIITFHEAMLAFSSESEWSDANYRLDFRATDDAVGGDMERMALLQREAARGLQLTAVGTAGAHSLVPMSAADYLIHKRSWQGVEAPLAGAEPVMPAAAVAGRSGRAAGYFDEPADPP